MRLFILALIAMLSVQLLDMPPARSGHNPKTCCGRAVCLCKHAKGAFCPIKHKKQLQLKAVTPNEMPQPHCHLPAVKNAERLPGKSDVKQSSRAERLLSKAPCASDTSKTVVPGYSRDFDFVLKNANFSSPSMQFIPLNALAMPILIRSTGIDRPPRFLLSF